MIKIRKTVAVSRAVIEQLKSQAPENGLEKGKRGTVAIPQQIVGSRRSTENIFAGMIKDEWPLQNKINKHFPVQHIKKSSTRKRKRGPRSIQYYEKN